MEFSEGYLDKRKGDASVGTAPSSPQIRGDVSSAPVGVQTLERLNAIVRDGYRWTCSDSPLGGRRCVILEDGLHMAAVGEGASDDVAANAAVNQLLYAKSHDVTSRRRRRRNR